jgi:LuxR family maltose regulon positive regulatory protein
MIQTASLPALDVLTTELINGIEGIQQKFILVLDDYHLIREKSIHKIINRIIDFASECMHLVIICREDVPLPLPKYRAKQYMNEISTNDLCFTFEESRLFLERMICTEIKPEYVAILYARTEGWAAGLQLAGLSMRNSQDQDAFVRTFNGSHRDIMDYLMDEVISNLSADVQDFLLKTSILNMLSAPLCKVLIDKKRDTFYFEHLLERLEKNGLFIIPLDDQRIWYRYNYLFQELLVHRLTKKYPAIEIIELHKKAGEWFSNAGQVDAALEHLTLVGDEEDAAILVEKNIHPALNNEEWRTIERWCNKLPSSTISERPSLLLARAWILLSQFNIPQLIPLIIKIDTLISDGKDTWNDREMAAYQAELDILRCGVQTLQPGNHEVLETLQSALKNIPPDWSYIRSSAIGWIALNYQFSGHENEAANILTNELDENILPHGYKSRILVNLSNIHRIAGRLSELEVSAQKLLWMAEKDQMKESLAWAHFLLGVVEYERNQLDNARQNFNETRKLKYQAQSFAYQDTLIGLALVHQAQGKEDEAKEIAANLLKVAMENFDTLAILTARSFQARLALMRGDLKLAKNLLPTSEGENFLIPAVQFEIDSITYCLALLVENTPSSLQKVEKLLDLLLIHSQKICSRWLIIQVLLLQALDEHVKGNNKNVAMKLEQAISTGRVGGFTRIYFDLGPEITSLLVSYLELQEKDQYYDQLKSIAGMQVSENLSQTSHDILEKELTQREKEILLLVKQDLSDKEIANRLTISPLTVKKHLRNVYQKLQVSGRRQAVARSILKNLLS